MNNTFNTNSANRGSKIENTHTHYTNLINRNQTMEIYVKTTQMVKKHWGAPTLQHKDNIATRRKHTVTFYMQT